MSFGRRPGHPAVRRIALALVPAALCVALAACSGTGGGTPTSTTGGGPVDAQAGSAAPFTPDPTPTRFSAGAYAKPSTGGVRYAPTASGPLDGKTITIDPGHNTKWETSINMKSVHYFGAGWRPCQNLGSTALDKKTLEADIVWNIATKMVPILRSGGATVWLTRPDNNGLGPCNDERAEIANRSNSSLLVSIHGDGNTNAKNRGFFVIHSETMQGGAAVVAASSAAAKTLAADVAARSQIPVSNYIGTGSGTMVRSNELGVLNTMKTGPAVLIEVGNIIQKDDWGILSTDDGLEALAEGIAAGASDIVLGTGSASASGASPAPTKG